jgi:hypothetical protein
MTFTLNTEANTTCTFFQCYIDDDLAAYVQTLPAGTGFGEDGYGEKEWRFVDGDGIIFNCYTRYGVMRIGGRGHDPAPFIAWLEVQAWAALKAEAAAAEREAEALAYLSHPV